MDLGCCLVACRLCDLVLGLLGELLIEGFGAAWTCDLVGCGLLMWTFDLVGCGLMIVVWACWA